MSVASKRASNSACASSYGHFKFFDLLVPPEQTNQTLAAMIEIGGPKAIKPHWCYWESVAGVIILLVRDITGNGGQRA